MIPGRIYKGILTAVALTALLSACGDDDDDGQVQPPVNLEAAVTVADQTLNPANEVDVTTIVALENGFIVIHEANEDGGIGGAIGNAFVSQGTSRNIEVTLDRDGVDGETLFAMLHIDGDGNGVYEFPEEEDDAPVLDADGEVIAPPFVVTVEGDEPDPVASVSVDDQTADPANVVIVAEVVTVGPGFIAVHEDDGDGGIGGVVGVSDLLEDGTHANVSITLDRNVSPDSETLFAMLHTDSNDNGVYEFPTDGLDGPVLDADGNVIAPPFSAQSEPVGPSVSVDDQEVDPANEVVIGEVIFEENGFIAVHEDDGQGGIGGVVGVSDLLEAGVNTDIVVVLDRPAADGETLFAMLHTDSNDNGVYEFPTDGLDGPVLVDDAVLAPPFIVTLPPVEGDPSVTVDSQIADPASQVVVREVLSIGTTFIAIHETNQNGGIGAVVGVSAALTNGINTDITITLDKEIVPGEIHFAMLHDDANDNGFYEFPGPDVPINDTNGVVIAPPFASFLPNPEQTVIALDQVLGDASDTVSVLTAVSEGAGFIAVHEDDGQGGIGGVVGVSAVLADGVNSNISVTLDRPAVDGETLFAMLHDDSNDNGVYEFPTDGLDGPIFDGDNNVIAPPFVVTLDLTPSVNVEDQTATPANQIFVQRAISSGPGFIAVHEDDGQGGIGGVIGVSAVLDNGVNTNITVTLDRNANDGETLFAMLHTDSNDNGVYEFPTDGLDGPVLDGDDNVIAPAFVVTVINEVFVDSQIAEGDTPTVVVREVIYRVGGFIAVHEANENGGIGGVVGVSAFLAAGSNFDVDVVLDRPIVAGEVLFAMLHRDVNENEIYEFPGPDVPVNDAEGVVIAPPFAVFGPDPAEAVVARDQTADPLNVVSILAAVSEGSGFIAVHEDNGQGGIGGVIGVSAVLSDGINDNIIVVLDRNIDDGETLFAMLHDDSNDNGVYEFPTDGLDGPILDGNDIVIAPPFTVSR